MEKIQKIAILKYNRNLAEVQPLEVNNVVFDFDEPAQRRLQTALNALDGSTEKVHWTTADDKEAELTVETIKEIFIQGAKRLNEIHIKYRKLRDAVNAAETEEEVDAIEW